MIRQMVKSNRELLSVSNRVKYSETDKFIIRKNNETNTKENMLFFTCLADLAYKS